MDWTPKRDFAEIRQMALDMQRKRSPLISKMLEVSRMYDGDIVIPLPDVKGEPNMPNLTPQQMTDRAHRAIGPG